MKSKYLMIFVCVVFLSCGSSERVITDSGEVYEVKGNKFYKNGEEVTDKLPDSKKSYINSILQRRLNAEEAAREKQEQIEDELDNLKERQKKLKKEQKQIERNVEAREEARSEFFKIKEDLRELKAEYEHMKQKGDLSAKEEGKWKKRLKKLEAKLKKAELKIEN